MKIKLLLSILGLLLCANKVTAYADCPFGESNDPYPGNCGRYIDTDQSGFCDHSETLALAQPTAQSLAVEAAPTSDPNELISGQELKTKTVKEVADIYKINVDEFIALLKQEMNIPIITASTPFQLLHDNYGTEPSRVKGLASDLAKGTVIPKTNQENKQITTNITQFKGVKDYNFGILSLIAVALYSISWTLAHKKKISTITHRRIWNFLLGIHFFITAVLGILLVLRISYGMTAPLPFNILFFHVETGIIFSLIGLFHIAWHWPYFKLMLRR